MEEALALAKKADGETWPNPMVGAVLVRGGNTVGRGYHKGPGQAHAEVAAILDAGDEAEGSTCFVNLEPCNHTGRTPPCSEAIIKAGIKKVIYGMTDPNPRVSGRGIRRLQDAGVEVEGPLLESAAQSLNAPFVIAQKEKRAAVSLKLALTQDGMLADARGYSGWITGEKARRKVHQLRAKHQAVMVGSGTFRADKPRLTARDRGNVGREHLTRIIVGSRVPDIEGHPILDDIDKNPVFFMVSTKEAQSDSARRAEDFGAEIFGVEPDESGGLNIGHVLEELYRKEIFALFCEGGAKIAASLLQENLVDRLHIFRAPIFLGSPGGIPGVAGLGIKSLEHALRFRRIAIFDHDEDLEEILVPPHSLWTQKS